MPQRSRPLLPSTSPLPSSLRLPPSSPLARQLLSRLSRPLLLKLLRTWLAEDTPQQSHAPVLAHDLPVHTSDPNPDELCYAPARSLPELREIYNELERNGDGKRDIIARVLEGDWRRGLSLRQLAAADLASLEERPERLKWTAWRLARLHPAANGGAASTTSTTKRNAPTTPRDAPPRFHGPTVVRALQTELGPLLRAHYHLARAPHGLLATLLRIWVRETPAGPAPGAGRTVYAAFPDRTGFVYLATAGGGTASRDSVPVIYDAISRAFAQGHGRWALKTTSMTACSLQTLVEARGPGKGGGAGGAWSVYARGTAEGALLGDAGEGKENIPLGEEGAEKRQPDQEGDWGEEEARQRKRRKITAQARFGVSCDSGDAKGVQRFQVRLEEPFSLAKGSSDHRQPQALAADRTTEASAPRRRGRERAAESLVVEDDEPSAESAKGASRKAWAPKVEITFHGPHIFAGVRDLVEAGAVVGERMPAWVTGAYNVTVGVV